ncbi:MAG: nucleotide sugar dehydrogenase [Patescibacteria group bacterium]|nr:nucleotide sugar dehydrogenase [Patescibacteria group bacterium]
MKHKKVVAIIGLGYVGLPLALLAKQKGYEVIGIDKDSQKVKKINSGISPIYDKKLIMQVKNHSIYATTKFSELVNADIIVICVPTPVKGKTPDLNPVKNASIQIAKHLKKGQLVLLESTVNPGVCEEIVIPILEKQSKLICGKDFHFAHCPERINPGDTKWHVGNIPRVVGGYSVKCLSLAYKFYSSIIDAPIKKMESVKEAESVKIVENCFRDVNIAFVNELAQSFSKLGIDVVNVIQGAATKPFAFMPHFPSRGVGGHCIPVDPYYLIFYAKKHGFKHKLLKEVRRINSQMPHYTVDRTYEALNEAKVINGSPPKIAVLGLSYKKNIDDTRESPSYEIIKLLKQKGAEVRIYDPYVKDKNNAKNLSEAIDNADAVIVATAHSKFRKITPQTLKKAGVKILVDGENAFDKKAFSSLGILYKGIGR